MEKKVHIWQVKCRHCGTTFEHVFRAEDILRPHFFNELVLKCPVCGASSFDPVHPIGKLTLEEWQLEHPGMDINRLPDHSYAEQG